MQIKKSLLVAGATSAVALASFAGVGIASAATNSTSGNTLVDRIASKFNLNKSDVQSVFDQFHDEQEATRDKEVKSTLDQAVKDGKLTQDQEDKILAKRTELKNQREADRDAMMDKTEAERKSAMEAKRTELETWAKNNNIPTEYLRYVFGGPRHGHGPGGPGGMGIREIN